MDIKWNGWGFPFDGMALPKVNKPPSFQNEPFDSGKLPRFCSGKFGPFWIGSYWVVLFEIPTNLVTCTANQFSPFYLDGVYQSWLNISTSYPPLFFWIDGYSCTFPSSLKINPSQACVRFIISSWRKFVPIKGDWRRWIIAANGANVNPDRCSLKHLWTGGNLKRNHWNIIS